MCGTPGKEPGKLDLLRRQVERKQLEARGFARPAEVERHLEDVTIVTKPQFREAATAWVQVSLDLESAERSVTEYATSFRMDHETRKGAIALAESEAARSERRRTTFCPTGCGSTAINSRWSTRD